MASAAVLQPTQSFEMTRTARDISQARQRRRRSSRKIDDTHRSKDPNFIHVQGSDLNPDRPSSVRPWPVHDIVSSDVESSAAHGSISSGVNMQLGETARQRRRTRLKKTKTPIASKHAGDQSSVDQGRHSELEDSTAGVASILQKKLHQTEIEDKETPPQAVQTSAHKHTTFKESTPLDDTAGVEEMREHVKLDRPLPQLETVDATSVGSHVEEESEVTPTSTDILGITIHGADALKASVKLTHPCIRVTVVDASLQPKGSLAKKSELDRCVTSYYERGNPNVDYIMPVLTQPFSFNQQSEILQPSWEETLIFNEQLTLFTANENIIIFFELLDFSTSDSRAIDARSHGDTVTSKDRTPWYYIAWGFMRPAGKVCKAQMGQRCRVQLYKFPKRRFRSSTESIEVYSLWTKYYRDIYPSTLYVTLKSLPVDTFEPVEDHLGAPALCSRSMIPTLGEVGSLTVDQLLHKRQHTKSASSLMTPPSTLLSETARLPGQVCRVPITHTLTLRHTKMGCSALQFSHAGRLLAAGCADHDVYPLIVYEVPSFQPALVTEGHRGIIYALSWDKSDSMLATASSDGLVKVWSMDSTTQDPAFVLPHPCYVYSVCYTEDIPSSLIFTGAYDRNIRVWSLPTEPSDSPKLSCELRGQSGLINCLLWSAKERTLLAGDSQGEVCLWKEGQEGWYLYKKINAVKGCALTTISLHPRGRKLLIHTVRGRVSMWDLRIDHVCCEYKGINISQSQCCSSIISPCGGLIFAAGPPGQVHVWNTDTGKEVYHYSDELPINSTVSAIAYHPNEHMVIFSAYGTHEPIVVLTQKVDQSVLQSTTQPKHSIKNKLKSNKGQMSPPNLDTMEPTSMLHTSARLNEVARTLSRVTAFVKSSKPNSM